VESFLRAYDRSVVANDVDWSMAHMDPTALIRTAYGTITFAELQRSARRVKAGKIPSSVASSRSTIDQLEIVGYRALVKFTTTMRYRAGIEHDERWRNDAIFAWKDGDWRLWRLRQTRA